MIKEKEKELLKLNIELLISKMFEVYLFFFNTYIYLFFFKKNFIWNFNYYNVYICCNF